MEADKSFLKCTKQTQFKRFTDRKDRDHTRGTDRKIGHSVSRTELRCSADSDIAGIARAIVTLRTQQTGWRTLCTEVTGIAIASTRKSIHTVDAGTRGQAWIGSTFINIGAALRI